MKLTLHKAVKFYVCNFYTGWKKEYHEGIITSFHAPGWVTIRSNNETYYIQYKEIVGY